MLKLVFLFAGHWDLAFSILFKNDVLSVIDLRRESPFSDFRSKYVMSDLPVSRFSLLG